MESLVKCPECGSEALNKYGRITGGKQRYICLVCNRQFVGDRSRQGMKDRPLCPLCGGAMHSYGAGNGFRRFRCSKYPKCRGYMKVRMEDDQPC